MSMESFGGAPQNNTEEVEQMLFSRSANELRMINEPKFDHLLGKIIPARGVKSNGYILQVNALLYFASPELRERVSTYVSSESEQDSGELRDELNAELSQLCTDNGDAINEGNLERWNAT